MNYEVINRIYRQIFKYGCSVGWLDKDRYVVRRYWKNGVKHWEVEYQNGELVKKIL